MSASKRRKWLHGLLAAAVGGFAGMTKSALLLVIVAPEKFSLGPDLRRTLLAILVLAVLSAAQFASAYLAQSPVPDLEDES